MAGYVTAGQQIVEIANSAYPYAVPYETMEQLQFRATLENMGYTIAKDGQAYYTGQIASAAAETGPVVGNTLIETKIVEEGGETLLNTSVPPATSTTGGTNLLKGALTANVSPMTAATAICLALGYEYEEIKQHPEFWTDLSDALLNIEPGDDPFETSAQFVTEGLNLKNGMNVVMRAVEDGGIKSYCEKKQIERAVMHLYEAGAFMPSAELEPQITHGGTYDIIPGGCDLGMALSVFDIPMPSSDSYQFMLEHFNNRTQNCNGMVVGCRISLWEGGGFVNLNINCYNISEGETMAVNYDNGTITVIGGLPDFVVSCVYEYNFYDGSLRSYSASTTTPSPNISNYINGTRGYYGIKSTINTTYIPKPDYGLTADPSADVLRDPADFDTLFADWLDEAFETDRVNPETGENEKVKWLPLELWDYLNNESTGPGNQSDVQSGTLPGKDGDPDLLPKYITDYLIPNINWPNFKFPETNTGDTPVIATPSNSLSNKLYTVYNPSNSDLNSLGAYLWNTSIIQQLVEMFTNNPMDAIISLHQIYATPTVGSNQNIILGCLDSGVSSPIVTNQYVDIDCGSVNVPELYGDARDYTDVECNIFLPFIGIRTIDCHDVINCNVRVVYHIDVYTGSTLAEIVVSKEGVSQVLYTFEGNCSVQIPLTAADRSRMVQGIVAATTGLITGGVGAMAGAAAASALGGAAQTSIQKSSGFSGNAGAMGCKTPYIVVTRRKSVDATNYAHMIGNPTNKSIYLKDCRGFTRVKSIHLEIEGATDTELNNLEEILKQGILI